MKKKSGEMEKDGEICEHVKSWLQFCAGTHSNRTTKAYGGTISQLLKFLATNGLSFSTEGVEAWLDFKLVLCHY